MTSPRFLIPGILNRAHFLLGKAVAALRRRISPRLVVHVYSGCWNDEFILPHYLRHYSPIAERIVLSDNMSTDGTLEIARMNPKVRVIQHETGNRYRIDIGTRIKNQIWKRSRGWADWIICVDVDEFLDHPNLMECLAAARRDGVTLLIPQGFDMVSDTCEVEKVTMGVPNPMFDKPCIFDPCKVINTYFAPGGHSASPSGTVVKASPPGLRLLHYKYLGLEYLLQRHRVFVSRMSEVGKQRRWGWEYAEQETIRNFNERKARAVKLL